MEKEKSRKSPFYGKYDPEDQGSEESREVKSEKNSEVKRLRK